MSPQWMVEPVPSISKTLFKKLIKSYQAKTLAAQASFKGCVRKGTVLSVL